MAEAAPILPGDSYGPCHICDQPIICEEDPGKTDRLEMTFPDAGYYLQVHWSCYCRALRYAGRKSLEKQGPG